MYSLEDFAHHAWIYRAEEVGNVHRVDDFLIHMRLSAVEYGLVFDSSVNTRRKRNTSEYVRVNFALQQHQFLVGNIQNSNAAVLFKTPSGPVMRPKSRNNMADVTGGHSKQSGDSVNSRDRNSALSMLLSIYHVSSEVIPSTVAGLTSPQVLSVQLWHS